MASLLSPRRPDGPARTSVALRASEASRDTGPADADVAPVSWPVAAVVGGLTTAATSWILVAGLLVLGWLLTEPNGLGVDPGASLELGTRVWLLIGGVSARVGTLPVSLVPWGATALLAVMLWRFGGYAARRVRPDQGAGPYAVAGVLLAAYALPVLGAAIFFGEPWRDPLHWVAVLSVLYLAALHGAAVRTGVALTAGWPEWLRRLPRALAGAQLVLLASGVALLVVGLVTGWSRVESLTRALHPGIAGGVLLVLLQLTLLPTLLVWSASYGLGAGFTLGTGSVVAPAATALGVLPGVPVLGALPPTGPGSAVQLWWLGAGVLAGAVAAWLMLRGGERRRFDQTSLLGGLAGLLAALLLVGLGWAASGDLGADRLAGLGPRLLPLLVMATTTMGLAGMIAGALIGLLRPRRAPQPVEPAEPEESAR